MKIAVLGLLTFALLAAHCPPPPPANSSDAGIDTEPVAPEEAACARLQELGCRRRDGRALWEPTPEGVSCPTVFANARSEGIDLEPECIARIATCEERAGCGPQ